ncbi:4-hydroxythreonine-4-phosphate dehydrogenase PdxA [Acetobacterium bakii]|uniref:4-hydroxythreonine-4-phosphate dehydrogenase PdxA n=1 Tax=Acetobacterium bakii TaxID=52689 RepID=UPI000AF0B3F1|nr:4-hydroxythreonine-4-phosphate dehydrogenase PdxA [Acetobacterium bakii]
MKTCLGITIGDPAGVGPEITLKAMMNSEVLKATVPIAIGDKRVLEKAKSIIGSSWELIEIDCIEDIDSIRGSCFYYLNINSIGEQLWEYGKVDKICGAAAFSYITKAIDLAMSKKIDGVVTAPINKEAFNLAGYHFSGHTEIFAHQTKAEKFRMLLTGKKLKVIHVTTHSSMRKVCDLITCDRVFDTIVLADQTAKLLGKSNPVIGVAGFNPHSSENGLFGEEEEKEITPAIKKAQAVGINVVGPISPDTVFVKALGGDYDIVVAMYHDQGHIPLKLEGFKMDPLTKAFTSLSGVNSTVGLPIIRTSVDHGTAFDKAGTGEANEESMIEALLMAAKMAENQKIL